MLALALFALASARIKNAAPLGSAGGGGLSYNSNCNLTFGFNFERIGRMSECPTGPVKIPRNCADLGDNPNQLACISKRNAEHIQNYYHTVHTTSSSKSLLDVAVSAEGGGWGVSMSASVGFQSAHQSSVNSASWYLGAGGSLYTKEVLNHENMELTEGALYLLKTQQWYKFLRDYGTHYVSKIEYGGSFIGNVEIQSSMSSDSMAIDVAASMSYGEGPFTVSGKVKFKTQMSKMTETTTQTQWMRYEGGSTQFHPLNTSKMVDSYQGWWKKVQEPDQAIPLVMFFRSYYDIAKVQYYVDRYAPSNIAQIFNAGQPTPTVINYVTKEYAMTQMALNSVLHAKTYHCAHYSSSFKKKVEGLEKEIAAHKENMERLDMATLAELDINIGYQNFTFFKAYFGIYDNKLRTLLESNRACSSCEMKSTGMWGPNLKSFPKVEGYFGCKARCQSNPECVSFAHFKTTKYDQCYLKSEWQRLQKTDTVYSVGPKYCRCFEYNIDYWGADLVDQTPNSTSPEACQKLCQGHDQCETWTWLGDATPAAKCYLKKASGYTPKVIHGHVSGPKNCPYPLDLLPN